MTFLVHFDLPDHGFPERRFEAGGFRRGRVKAKQMALTLRLWLGLPTHVPYFLYVHVGEGHGEHGWVDEFAYAKEFCNQTTSDDE